MTDFNTNFTENALKEYCDKWATLNGTRLVVDFRNDKGGRVLFYDATPRRADIILFKPGGKYYTQETWSIPPGAIGPYDMINSKDYRRIDGGPVLVPEQEPWGYPHLL